MKNILITFSLLTLSLPLFAVLPTSLSIEPVIGFERVYQFTPTAHLKTRLIYGVRAIWGLPLISAEGEITRSDTSESFPSDNLKINEESYALKIGLRSGVNLGAILRWYLRGGIQGRKTKKEVTESGVKTTTDMPVYLDPYAGTGLTIRLGKFIYASLGVTAVFTGRPKGDDIEFQTTSSLRIKI